MTREKDIAELREIVNNGFENLDNERRILRLARIEIAKKALSIIDLQQAQIAGFKHLVEWKAECWDEVAKSREENEKLKANFDTSKITRIEVIDEKGRSYVNLRASDVSLSFQDENRTLKIFTKGERL